MFYNSKTKYFSQNCDFSFFRLINLSNEKFSTNVYHYLKKEKWSIRWPHNSLSLITILIIHIFPLSNTFSINLRILNLFLPFNNKPPRNASHILHLLTAWLTLNIFPINNTYSMILRILISLPFIHSGLTSNPTIIHARKLIIKIRQ